MTEISARLRALLEDNAVDYERIHHHRDFTAMEAAADTHTPGKAFAKAVVVKVGDELAMAVLPSNHMVDPERLSFALGGKAVALAEEKEIDALCTDCEPGAIPPFGNLYGLPVIVSPELAKAEHITCVAGSHAEAIRLAYRDFERLVQPRMLDFSVVYHGRESHMEGPERG